ncbi:S9 family peptidase [Sediminicola sp. YIK13]|uniref:S9 family peptidase n=1 Tax=Sediminicola sp. YIK13 TaxID=1453352 RepID=UPI000B101156|nr:S9 family peptidase [Sediminicola sp. YIK13]
MITNRIPLFLLIISFAYPWMGHAQSDKKSVTIEELMQLKTVKNPVISPDGQWVAFTVAEMDLKKDAWETRIWMVPSKGGEAIPMTAKGYSASEPKWSSDNKYLSFLASKKEGDKTQVWTLNRQGGEAEQLTKIPQGVSSHEWSPKGKELMLRIKDPKPEELTADKEDDKKAKPYVVDRLQFKQDYQGYLDRYRTHLYILTMGDSIPRQITSGDFDDEDPVWSPDGTQIAFTSNRSDNPDGNSNTDIWIVNTVNTNKGESLRQVTTNPNADFYPRWSPDGKHLVYRTVTDKKAIWYATQKLAIIPVDGGQPTLLAEALDRNISKPTFSEDGKLIYFILEESGTSVLASIDPSGNNLKKIIQGDISISDYDVKAGSIFPLLGKANQPYEVYNFTKSLKQLTSLNDGLLNKMEKPSIDKVHFKSADGTQIEGFVVKPIGFDAGKKYPTILWLHGGPVSQYQFEYDIEPQLFASNGYVTLLINPRGSSGYGQAFSEALFADWGNKDYQDVMAGIDYVIGQGYADPTKLGVGGWSYGGILTNYVITKTDRFKGAVSGASEALYRSNYGHDHYQLTWELELGLPWENAEAWEKISPFNQVANITTPTLWIGGEKDWNVPILNSEQMYQAMKRLGRDTQLVVYPGEHHGIKRPSFVKDRLERYLQWFKTHVKGEK